MKKIWVALLSFIMSIAFCFGLTACDPAQVVGELTNEIGAMIEGGGFLKGSELNFECVTEEQAEEIIAQLESSGIALDDTTKAYIYDIFVTKGDKEVQPDGEVTVTVPAPEDENAVGYNVYHVKDSGAIESIPSTYEDGKIKFKTDGFSYYVLVPTYNFVNVSFKGDLYVGLTHLDSCDIYCNGVELIEEDPKFLKGSYLCGKETTLEVVVTEKNLTFLGWYEAEDFYLDNYEKPVLKDAPVSTDTTYTFSTREYEYMLYAVFAEESRPIYFNVSGRGEGGFITIGGEPVDNNYIDRFEFGKSYELEAIANEGYRFVGWNIYGGVSYRSVEESRFTLVTNTDESSVTAVFEPVVTSLTVDMNDLVYDVTLLEKYESISIPDFNAICKEGSTSEKWKTDYVIFGKIKSISSTTWGNMIIVDDEGNELHVFGLYLEDGTRYGLMENKPVVGDFIAVHGKPYIYRTEPEMQKGYLLDATPILPNFDSVTVHAYTPKGSSVLSKDEYTVDVSTLNTAKPGEYLVTYTYNENPEIKATVSVKVLANAPVDFSAWVNGGTLLLDGVEIGLDYFETFKDGFGKVTLTAVGEENTVFNGWYISGDNSRTPISTDETYTFEFDENTYVYAEYEYVASEIWLDGMNMGFDTDGGITEIWLPTDGEPIDVSRILVFALINGEREALTADEYTIDLDGFDGTNPAKGDYTLTFTYKENPDLKATHILRVIDEENMVWLEVSCSAGGRVIQDKPYNEFNKGDQVTLSVELRSESDYEFLGWYTMDASGAVGTTCVSTERTYTVTLNETTYLYAKIEPKITYLEVEGYEGNPTRVNVGKFWMDTREFIVYGCGALGKREQLEESEYTVDWGGLDLANPVVGKYVITYTYNENPDVKYEITVFVWEKDYSFSAVSNNPNLGYLIFENEITTEAGGMFIEGEEVSVTAIANEGLTFMGWYEVISHDTHNEYVLISLEQNYTFIIDKDITLEAKFDAPVTSISLDGVFMNNDGSYYIDVTEGDSVDLSVISVIASSQMGDTMLGVGEYVIDYDGLDVANPTYGSYTLVYTYGDTDITTTLVVNVFKRVHFVSVVASGGRFEFEGAERASMSQYFDEDSVLILKAGEFNSQIYEFLGWYEYDVKDDEWKAFSTDESVAITVNGDRKIRCKFGYATTNINVYDNGAINEKGVNYFYIEENATYDEITGKYVTYGCIDLLISSEYADNLEKLFSDANIFVKKCDGSWTKVNANDIVLDLGSYKPEYGWYTVVLKCGTLVVNIDVCVY